jgi:hypothetical protein
MNIKLIDNGWIEANEIILRASIPRKELFNSRAHTTPRLTQAPFVLHSHWNAICCFLFPA